tara:strand:- start:1572 stop:2759 length:1188 start_codon:yes stop_codon:yes gene_type:complete
MGSVNLDNTGSGSAITLSSDGTSLLLDGTAIGGGGGDPALYADNASSAVTPIATGANAFSIGTNTTASNTSAIAIGADAVASGYQSQAIGNQTDATATNSSALGVGAQATASNATAVGGARAEASYSTAIGKTSSNSGSVAAIGAAAMALNGYASGAASFAAAIDSNTSTYGAQGTSCIAMGSLAKAWDGTATIAIGQNNVANSGSSIMGGKNNITTKNGAFIGGGDSNKVSSDYGRAGGRYAWSHAVEGKDSWSSGRFAANGDSQAGTFVFRAATTNATAKEMTTNGSAQSYTTLNVPNNSAFSFSGTIVARQKASEGTASAAWKVEGLIRREGSAGTTVLVNSATTVLDNAPSWGMALTANTTNGGLAITVTGAAATNVRFVATIMTSEVTYA